jgi:endonuclease IV
MLIGAHVSTAGGLPKAIERGTEIGCESIQIFHQSPRMWRPTRYGSADFAAFREAMANSPIEAVVIHAVYLINCATKDKELRKNRSPRSPTRCASATRSAPPGSSCTPGPRKGSRWDRR